jgi:chromosome segregation ATPase
LNQSIGQRRVEADQAATDRQKALDDRAVLERERMDLAAQMPTLRSQRDALQKERDTTAEQAANAQAALDSTRRERDVAELEVVRLRTLTAGLAAPISPDIARSKPETH